MVNRLTAVKNVAQSQWMVTFLDRYCKERNQYVNHRLVYYNIIIFLMKISLLWLVTRLRLVKSLSIYLLLGR